MKYKDYEFLNIINDILSNDVVQSLHSYKHHYSSNRFEHCMSVAYFSYKICKFLHLDYISVARAGLLHDLFLYDCETSSTRPKFHIWIHPRIALRNANQLFDLNDIEKDIVLKHMWPITLMPPKYFESFIVSFVDKYCAFKEWIYYSKFMVWNWYVNLFYIIE